MDKNEDRLNDETKKLINEPGSIGEESLPADGGEKTDKQAWDYTADKARREGSLGDLLHRFFGGRWGGH